MRPYLKHKTSLIKMPLSNQFIMSNLKINSTKMTDFIVIDDSKRFFKMEKLFKKLRKRNPKL